MRRKPTRRTVLVAGAALAIAGCTDSESPSDEGSEAEPAPAVLSAEGVEVTAEGDTVTVTDFGEASAVYLRGITGIREYYTLEPTEDSLEATPGHYTVVADEDPDGLFGETELGVVRIGEPAFSIEEDWSGHASTATNTMEDAAALLQADPNQATEWRTEIDVDEQLGEIVAVVDPERSSGQFQVHTFSPAGGQQISGVRPGEDLARLPTEPAGFSKLSFDEAGTYEISVQVDGDGEQIALDRLYGLVDGPATIIDD